MVGSRDQERAQLVESGVARPHRAAAFEQEQARVLTPTTTAGEAQTLAAEQPARGQSGVEQIALPPPALLTARALALGVRRTVEGIERSISRSSVFSYTEGYRLCSAFVGGDPRRFERLLKEQLTLEDL